MKDKDKIEIRKIIQEDLKAALVRTITIERGPRQQGDPEKVIKEEQWNVLDFMAAYAPKIEGALRGMQEDVDRTANSVKRQEDRISAVGQVLLSMETAAKRLAIFSDYVRTLELDEGNTPRRYDRLIDRGNGGRRDS